MENEGGDLRKGGDGKIGQKTNVPMILSTRGSERILPNKTQNCIIVDNVAISNG